LTGQNRGLSGLKNIWPVIMTGDLLSVIFGPVSDSPGRVDFAIGLANSVFNVPDGQVMFCEEFE